MAGTLENFLKYDDLTVLLGVTVAGIYFLSRWIIPTSLVHPILLGRQSDAANVRKAGESAVYRNFGTGSMGGLPSKPAKDIHLVTDLLRKEYNTARVLWSTQITNADLDARSSRLAINLVQAANLVSIESTVLVLLNDGLENLLTDLALAKAAIPSTTVTTLNLLSPVLEHYPPAAIITHAHFLTQLLELLHDARDLSPSIVVVGDDPQLQKLLDSTGGPKIILWNNLDVTPSSTSSTLPSCAPSNVITLSFYSYQDETLHGVRLTHENIVAGVTATRILPPIQDPLKPMDTIYSSHSIFSPVGRAITYTAVYEGTGFSTLDSVTLIPPYNLPTPRDLSDIMSTFYTAKVSPPTVLFVNATHIESMTTEVLNDAKSTVIFNLAWRHKLGQLLNGYSSRFSIWDSLLFQSSRAKALGKVDTKLRLIVVTDPILNATVLPSHIALALPIIKSHSHPVVCGPVFASHPQDLQFFPDVTGIPTCAHVGPPSVNVEVKLTGVNDSQIEKGGDPSGQILARGPTIGSVVPSAEEIDHDSEGWRSLNERASISSNGTFTIFRPPGSEE